MSQTLFPLSVKICNVDTIAVACCMPQVHLSRDYEFYKMSKIMQDREVWMLIAQYPDMSTIGIDYVGNVYTYVGQTLSTLSNFTTMNCYSVAGSNAARPSYYLVAHEHIIFEKYRHGDTDIEIHHIGMRLLNGNPEIVFTDEFNNYPAILPALSSVIDILS